MTNTKATEGEGQEVDIYRDTPVRLLGYANEVGEAFRALIHVNWVRASYGVASIYVLVSYTVSMFELLSHGFKNSQAL